MTCGCNDKCELPKALQINNPGEVTLFHRVEVPASQGDDTTYPPKNGLYRNVLLVYLANNHSYLYNSDGIPTRVDGPQGETGPQGPQGPQGEIGPAGPGVAPGGEAGQVLAKNSDSDYDTTWITQTSANDATLTISRNNTPVGTFTANASVDKTIDIEVPTKTSDLTNDGATGDSTYVEATTLSDYYTKSESNSTFVPQTRTVNNKALSSNITLTASDVGALPDSTVIPTVNDATLTIQQNGTTVETFTANSSSNKTANITVPTKTSDLTNDGADGTSTYVEADEFAPSYITGEGTDIALSGTQGSRFSNVELKGDTDQTTYSGKNLLPNNLNTQTLNDVTFTKNNDGSIKIFGTATARNEPMLWQTSQGGSLVFTAGKTYKNTTSVALYFHASGYFKIDAGATFSPSSNQNCDQAYIRVENGETIDTTIYPQIIESGVDESYEPYVGGVASPNPDYPQDVNVVTGEQTVKITGKNLLKLVASANKKGLTVTQNQTTGEITYSGTTTDSYPWINGDFSTNNPIAAGTYTVSIDKALSNELIFRFYNASGQFPTITSMPAGQTSATVTVGYEIQRVVIMVNVASGVTVQETTIKPMLEKGSTATDFKPYQEQTYTINLGTTELCKIGDYQDYIYKSNGTWYLHKEVRHISLSVSDMNNQENYAGWNDVPELSNLVSDLGSGLNTGLDQVTAVMANFITPSLHSLRVNTAAGGKILFLPTYAYPNLTQTQWKTQYPDLTCEIYYGILNQPTDTQITGTLLDDLNAFEQATSYQGDTYITVSSVSPDLPAILSVTTEEKSVLPTATETSAGVVSVGDGLEVTEGGVLSLADNGYILVKDLQLSDIVSHSGTISLIDGQVLVSRDGKTGILNLTQIRFDDAANTNLEVVLSTGLPFARTESVSAAGGISWNYSAAISTLSLGRWSITATNTNGNITINGFNNAASTNLRFFGTGSVILKLD